MRLNGGASASSSSDIGGATSGGNVDVVERHRLAGEIGLQLAQIALELAQAGRSTAEMRQGGIAAADAQHRSPVGDPVDADDRRGGGSGMAGYRVGDAGAQADAAGAWSRPWPARHTGSPDRFCESTTRKPSQPASSCSRAVRALARGDATPVIQSSMLHVPFLLAGGDRPCPRLTAGPQPDATAGAWCGTPGNTPRLVSCPDRRTGLRRFRQPGSFGHRAACVVPRPVPALAPERRRQMH